MLLDATMQGWGFVLSHPYLLCILFGMPSVHSFTFKFLSLVYISIVPKPVYEATRTSYPLKVFVELHAHGHSLLHTEQVDPTIHNYTFWQQHMHITTWLLCCKIVTAALSGSPHPSQKCTIRSLRVNLSPKPKLYKEYFKCNHNTRTWNGIDKK